MAVRDPRPIPAEITALIHWTARMVYARYVPEGARGRIERADLEQQGILGWLEAPEYDETRNPSLAAFARPYVRGRMVDFLRHMLSQVRLPQHRRAQVRALDEVKWAMRESGEEPSPENLAAKLGWSVDEVARVERETPRVSSLAARDHDDDGNLDSELPSDAPGPEQSLLRKQIADHLQECLGELDPVDRLVVVGRKLEGLKLRDFAAQLDCSMERVRQREQRALSKLRECLETRGFTAVETIEAGVNEGDLRQDKQSGGGTATRNPGDVRE